MNGRRKLVAVLKCPNADLNTRGFDWFCSARGRNIPVTGRLDGDAGYTMQRHRRNKASALHETALQCNRLV